LSIDTNKTSSAEIRNYLVQFLPVLLVFFPVFTFTAGTTAGLLIAWISEDEGPEPVAEGGGTPLSDPCCLPPVPPAVLGTFADKDAVPADDGAAAVLLACACLPEVVAALVCISEDEGVDPVADGAGVAFGLVGAAVLSALPEVAFLCLGAVAVAVCAIDGEGINKRATMVTITRDTD
jgi:hypothetical protein